MKSVGTLVIAFFVSTFVAGIVQNQLAVALGAREEFIGIVSLFLMLAVIAIVAFALALGLARSAAGIDWTALGLLIATAAVVFGLGLFGSGGKIVITRQDLPILAEIIIPTALMIAIQWWFVRRRWKRNNAG